MSSPELTLVKKEELDWQDEGICRQTDPEVFYPEVGQESWDAKKICKGCPVRDKCLMYAFETEDEWAVMGGLTYRERKKFRRQRVRPTKENIDAWIDRSVKDARERRQRAYDKLA